MSHLKPALKYSATVISLVLVSLLVIKTKAVFYPGFSRTSDPSVFSQQTGFTIPAHAQILDAGIINTFGIYPLHESFAVFILQKSDLPYFLKQPGIKSYNPSNARSGKQYIVDAPRSLGFRSEAWKAADATQFRVYHFSGQAGNILVDHIAAHIYKVYLYTDS